MIESRIEKYIANINAEIVLYCNGGYRSALAVDNLQKMEYSHVASFKRRFTAWLNEGNITQK